MVSTQSTSKPMYTHWNLAVLYFIELSTPAYIAFDSADNVINGITNDVIGIKQWRDFPLNIAKPRDISSINQMPSILWHSLPFSLSCPHDRYHLWLLELSIQDIQWLYSNKHQLNLPKFERCFNLFFPFSFVISFFFIQSVI